MSEHAAGRQPDRGRLTWEEAFRWLREQPDQQALVRDCYYDDPLLSAAQRFAESEEWQAVRALLPPKRGRALDLGAGRGIASYALVRDGWVVTAVEPDASTLVGAGAVCELAIEANTDIAVVRASAEALPFADRSLDLVYCRAVLHHARDLHALCREVARVLGRGGLFVATREHVISRPGDLATFLRTHPLHHLHGQEHAYQMKVYLQALRAAGLRIRRVLGPFDSPINYAPMTREAWRLMSLRPLAAIMGARAVGWLAAEAPAVNHLLLKSVASLRSSLSRAPGRLYSFIAER